MCGGVGHSDLRRDKASSDEAERSASLRKESRSGSGVGGGGGKRKRSLSALKPGDLDGDSVEEVMVLSSDENEHGEDNDMLFANGGSHTPRQRDGTEKVSGRGKGVGGVSPEMMRPSKKMKKVKHTVVVEDAAAAGEEEEMMFGGGENKGSGGKNKVRKGEKAIQHALFDADAFLR